MQGRPITRVLLANRGEIALRAARTCRDLGIESVAVYSSADAASPHVWAADQAVCIGPPAAAASYLNEATLLHVAKITECDAIYPGYGFLAERAGFCQRCADEGLAFIGPDPSTIETMGDKAKARETAARFGVPLVPGSDAAYTDATAALAAARDIGFPLLLKARSGGGGKGMRVAANADVFAGLFAQAVREAEAAFNDGAVYLERFFSAVRHVEVQVFGDMHGRLAHLGERDCTVQRRHQKLIEEGPSPALSPQTRAAIHEAATKLSEGIGYVGAGTVEFIYDEATQSFYFIEMNTRIQVEHPVSEMLSGHDLVAEQFKVARGEPLSVALPARPAHGHVIEFRINAEDWTRGFVPQPGRLAKWRPPQAAFTRVDSYAYPGLEIAPFYDSMVAKLLVTGETRAAAIENAKTALDAFIIEGPPTTLAFHRAVLDDEDFRAGRIHTRWVEETFLPRHGY